MDELTNGEIKKANSDLDKITIQAELNRQTAGQRHVNLIWEATQALIALITTVTFMYAAIKGVTSETLVNGFFLIVGFYFGRTNHQRVGGVQIGR